MLETNISSGSLSCQIYEERLTAGLAEGGYDIGEVGGVTREYWGKPSAKMGENRVASQE